MLESEILNCRAEVSNALSESGSLNESPGIPGQPVASYFARATDEGAYAAVNWGTERHVAW